MTTNDTNIANHIRRKGGLIQRIIRSLTRWAWRDQIKSPYHRAYERGIISSNALHEIEEFTNQILKP